MNQFLSFVSKEFKHILRDRRTVMILLIMPVIQIILFGFAISTEVSHINVAVYDNTKDATTSQLTEKFGQNAYFNVTHIIKSADEIDELFRRNETDLVMVFEENFSANLIHSGRAAIQLIADGTEPNRATSIMNYASNIIAAFQQEMMPTTQPVMQIIPEIKMLYNPQMKSGYNFVPGVMGLILMLICAMMTSISIVREKEMGTMEVLLVSPLKPSYIILSKLIPYLALSLVNLVTILLLSVFVLDVPVAGNLFALGLVSLLFIFLALSFGILISTLVDSQIAAMLASGMVLMIPIILLSGMIFPIESMPGWLQWLSAVLPARWFISAVKKIMIEGLALSYAWKEMIILAGMLVVVLGASIKKFKYRL